MIDFSINYLISGPAHLPYLVVSLNSLRRHFDGPVFVWAYPESFEIVKRISDEENLDIVANLWEPVYRGKNGQFLNKIAMMRSIHSRIGMYLDADTLIRKPFPSLPLESYSFIGTQFCDWISNVGTIKKRVNRLRGRTGIDQDAVEFVLKHPMPSLNGGVFFAKPKSEILKVWFEWSMIVKDIFICDETVLHAIMGMYRDSDEFAIATGGSLNCSPKYIHNGDLKANDVVVWHGHGDCFVRPKKCAEGYHIWRPEFDKCLEDNVGGMQEWINQIQHKFLTPLLKGVVA